MQTTIRIAVIFISVSILWSVIAYWELKYPDKTPEELKVELYYRCVGTASVNNYPISNCDQIR